MDTWYNYIYNNNKNNNNKIIIKHNNNINIMQYYRHPIITPYFEMGFNFGHQTSRHGDSWPHLLVRGSRSPKVLKEPSVRISRPPKQWRNLKEVGASNHSEYLHTFITMYDIWYMIYIYHYKWYIYIYVSIHICTHKNIYHLSTKSFKSSVGWFKKTCPFLPSSVGR